MLVLIRHKFCIRLVGDKSCLPKRRKHPESERSISFSVQGPGRVSGFWLSFVPLRLAGARKAEAKVSREQLEREGQISCFVLSS